MICQNCKGEIWPECNKASCHLCDITTCKNGCPVCEGKGEIEKEKNLFLHSQQKTEKEENKYFEIVQNQLQTMNENNTKIYCAVCDAECPIRYMYRCYFCGLWLCAKCSQDHFGEKPKIGIRYKEKSNA